MPNKYTPDLRLPAAVKDPTGTGLLRRSYQARLYDLFKAFNIRLQPRVDRLLMRTSEDSGFLKEFVDKVDETQSLVIRSGAPKIIQEHITSAFKRGKQVASSNPRLTRQSIIIDSRLSRTDNLVIQDLIVRNFNLINDDTIKKTLLQVMTEDIRQGKGTSEMAKDIRDNILDIGKNRSMMIARTELSFSYNNAIAKTYQDADIEQWQWLTAMGDLVCPECMSRQGVVYDWGDEQPPIHPNCMCIILPVVGQDLIIKQY